MARSPAKKRSFHQELVLNRWMLSHFRGKSLAVLKERLGADRHEGLDDDGQTRFFHELVRDLFEYDRITNTQLRRYDLNIVGHWKAITEKRNLAEGAVLTMKYFQYLSLLFSEIYLDWYFNHRQDLLNGLNTELEAYRAEEGAEPFRPYTADDLNKIAYWSATGSGKTLLLHVNIRQYLHYYRGGNAGTASGAYPDKIIILTPNEGLSRQHLEELTLSGFSFHRLFDKNRAPDFPGTIEVIDVNKLGDEHGDKTVAVDSFEGDNLVLVDEGHRGTSSGAGAWLARREKLVSKGFAFEYSATFSQAVGNGATVDKAEEELLKKKAKRVFPDRQWRTLTAGERSQLSLSLAEQKRARSDAVKETYAKAILFDYSYKFFYADGYGKEHLILNLADDRDEETRARYFTACLLAFYQQLFLWETKRQVMADFNIERPLWVFVGHTVAGEESDLMAVLSFLAGFLNNNDRAKGWIAELIADRAQLLDTKGRSIFAGRFTPLLGQDADAVYADILRRVFNAESRQRLKLINLKSSKGELALRVGTSEPFGLINIGDDSGFYRTADDLETKGFDTESYDFAGSLFHQINLPDSHMSMLVGSRKFTEGWSSWRVSTMGLLNMGRGEGSQIIQLFGRGVRLKGRDMSLKRSLPTERPKGSYLEKLETLNIFGVRADYMATFREYLIEEGITPSDEIITLDFKTRSNLPVGRSLKTLKLRDGYKDNQAKGFKRTYYPWLYKVPSDFEGKIKPPHVSLDLYPRVEAMASDGKGKADDANVRHAGKIDRAIMAMFDWDRLFLSVQQYKLQKSWSNLRLDKARLRQFCETSDDWYTLFMPASELALAGFSTILKLQDVLLQLLCDYTDRFYQGLKAAYEGKHFDLDEVTEEHGSMLKVYQFEIENSDAGESYLTRLNALQALVTAGNIGEASKWHSANMVAISFDRHLFYPLLCPVKDGSLPLKMRPLGLGAESEVRFVQDLMAFYQSDVGREAIGKRSLYLLRNADTKAKGLGFALAGNFYPDFLLWLVDEETGHQSLSFLDPKGIRNLDLDDPKFGLFQEVKKLEAEIGDGTLSLNAFILSETDFGDLINSQRVNRPDLEARNVLFMERSGAAYLTEMFARLS
ncbi:DEAD/DEAH box helicase family protein [Novosphingobium sp. Chol11]|uniref:DEAD/DEAH box helicase family protein n=1 Tax=Novosphingobium sp. Chol11 TaxID=1385763 RepID=UPI0025DF1C1C|nr:DEAD/DEAH box helicase family protein [Novosphingobium sp. Chol11]